MHFNENFINDLKPKTNQGLNLQNYLYLSY